MDFHYLALGGLLRLVVAQISFESFVETVFVGFENTHELMLEEAFVSRCSPCGEGGAYVVRLIASLVNSSSVFLGIETAVVIKLVGFVIQSICLCLVSSQSHSNSLFWLNPVFVISCAMSPVPALELLLLLGLPHLCELRLRLSSEGQAERYAIGGVCDPSRSAKRASTYYLKAYCLYMLEFGGVLLGLGLLVNLHSNYVCLCPAVGLLCFHSIVGLPASVSTIKPDSEGKGVINLQESIARRAKAVEDEELRYFHWFQWGITCLALGATSALFYRGRGRHSSLTDIHSGSVGQNLTFNIGVGMLWYLDAEVFADFRDYFAVLLVALPLLLVVPVITRFGKDKPLVAFHVICALALLFKRDLSLSDLFTAALLIGVHHERVIEHMSPTVVAATVLVVCCCAVLSLLMMHLWVVVGTGNANFLFFQGLGLWAFAAAGLVEFTKAATLA